MSSFIVDKEHIEQIVLYTKKLKGYDPYRYHHKGELKTFNHLESVAHILADANVRGVNYRYQEENKMHYWLSGEIESQMPKIKNPIQAIQLINCLTYQCCDDPSFDNSLANTILESIKSAVTRYMIDQECKRNNIESWKVWEYKEDLILNYEEVA
jgi:hypothetical protein